MRRRSRGPRSADCPCWAGCRGSRDRLRQRIGYVIAIADTRAKQTIAERLRPVGAHVRVGRASRRRSSAAAYGWRRGALINAGVTIAYDTVIGEHTTVNLNATVGHDCIARTVLDRGARREHRRQSPHRRRLRRRHERHGEQGPRASASGAPSAPARWSSGASSRRQHVFGNPARVVAPRPRRRGAAHRRKSAHAHP